MVLNRNVDLLFLVDDSSSMRLSQENLLRNFPVLMTALENMPGGLPNVHIAVVSSDMGAGDGSTPGCDATGGKNGIFQYTARGACTATGLDPAATFISNIAGVKNYTGNLPDVFTCIAALGETGCGFEHQFAAITRALGADGQPAPLENQGFLRPDAYLAIVMITNEDDCSVPAGVPLFDTSAEFDARLRARAAQQLSLQRVRSSLRRRAPPAASRRVATSTPREDVHQLRLGRGIGSPADGRRHGRAHQGAQPDPDNQIIVAGITGPEAPYGVHWKAPWVTDTGPWPRSPTPARPPTAASPIRRSAPASSFAQFGPNGLLLPICANDFAPPCSASPTRSSTA